MGKTKQKKESPVPCCCGTRRGQSSSREGCIKSLDMINDRRLDLCRCQPVKAVDRGTRNPRRHSEIMPLYNQTYPANPANYSVNIGQTRIHTILIPPHELKLSQCIMSLSASGTPPYFQITRESQQFRVH